MIFKLTSLFSGFAVVLNTAEATDNLDCAPVDAVNVVYRYQPTATAITSIIATIIAISIEVMPFAFGMCV